MRSSSTYLYKQHKTFSLTWLRLHLLLSNLHLRITIQLYITFCNNEGIRSHFPVTDHNWPTTVLFSLLCIAILPIFYTRVLTSQSSAESIAAHANHFPTRGLAHWSFLYGSITCMASPGLLVSVMFSPTIGIHWYWIKVIPEYKIIVSC